MKNTPLYILRLALTLLVITALVAAALAGVNSFTKDRIAAVKEEKTNAAILALFPESTQVSRLSADRYTDDSGKVTAVYQADQGFALEVRPNGFGGEIVLMVGIQEGAIVGVRVISHTETPSLGAVAAANNAAGEAFRNSFVGQGTDGALTVDSIDAISGATITSQAVVDGVNIALNCHIIQE